MQGNGDGEFNLFVTGGTQLGDWWHFISAAGVRLPADATEENEVAYWANHLDRRLWRDGLYFLGEANWFHWMRSAGVDVGADVTGLDLINVPAGNVAGTNVVTGVAGLKWKPGSHVEVGSGYEFPLTAREDILHGRVYADVIFRY